MHKVLIPLDYSNASIHAAEYAMDLLGNQPTRFVFLNVIDIRHSSIGLGGLKEKQEQGIKDDMDRIYSKLCDCNNYPGHSFEKHLIHSETISGIVGFAERTGASSIFMGTTGATGIKEKLMGSVASGVIRQALCPVMAIPSMADYSHIKRIALATDFKKVKDFDSYEYLLSLLKLYKVELQILNIAVKEQKVGMEQTMSGVMMENYLKRIPHRYEFVQSDSPVQAILDFVKTHDIQILAMLKHDYTMIKSLFTKSSVEKVAMQTHIPLLALPE